MFRTCVPVLFVGLLAATAHADTVAIYNFDSLPTGPSTFAAAGPPQTIVDTGVATFTGGVVLGDATNLPGLQYATPPNAYGTAGFADGTPNLLTIAISPTFQTDEVSFALLNGATIPTTYLVDAYNGLNLVGSQTFTNVAANSSSGFVLPNLMATNITSVTITSQTNDPSVDGYDFFIDTVAFNESINQEVNPTPEPSSLVLAGTGVLGMIGAISRRRRRS
jgi:hypothetical protein